MELTSAGWDLAGAEGLLQGRLALPVNVSSAGGWTFSRPSITIRLSGEGMATVCSGCIFAALDVVAEAKIE